MLQLKIQRTPDKLIVQNLGTQKTSISDTKLERTTNLELLCIVSISCFYETETQRFKNMN